MSKPKSWEVSDAFWNRVEQLIPLRKGQRTRRTGAKRVAGANPRMSALAEQGIHIGRYRARSLMRRADIKPVWKRKFMHTTDSKHNLPIAENVLARQFNPGAPNVAFVTNITYIRTGTG